MRRNVVLRMIVASWRILRRVVGGGRGNIAELFLPPSLLSFFVS